jgi:hypothetical protein
MNKQSLIKEHQKIKKNIADIKSCTKILTRLVPQESGRSPISSPHPPKKMKVN